MSMWHFIVSMAVIVNVTNESPIIVIPT